LYVPKAADLGDVASGSYLGITAVMAASSMRRALTKAVTARELL